MADDGQLRDDEPGLARDEAVVARMRRVLMVVGLGGGAVFAVVMGLVGFGGDAGFAAFLLMLALASAGAAGYGGVTALRDDLRDVHVSRRRVAWVLACFIATPLLATMLVGIGG